MNHCGPTWGDTICQERWDLNLEHKLININGASGRGQMVEGCFFFLSQQILSFCTLFVFLCPEEDGLFSIESLTTHKTYFS